MKQTEEENGRCDDAEAQAGAEREFFGHGVIRDGSGYSGSNQVGKQRQQPQKTEVREHEEQEGNIHASDTGPGVQRM